MEGAGVDLRVEEISRRILDKCAAFPNTFSETRTIVALMLSKLLLRLLLLLLLFLPLKGGKGAPSDIGKGKGIALNQAARPFSTPSTQKRFISGCCASSSLEETGIASVVIRRMSPLLSRGKGTLIERRCE